MKSKIRKLYFFYTIEFLMIALALILCLRKFSFITTGDGHNQYYPVMVYCGKYIRAVFKNLLQGNFILPQFDFFIGLGEGIVPALNYYGFGDPFMLISAAFPAAYSAYAYTCIVLAKMYVSGLSFIFFCKNRKYKEKHILLGAPIYIGSQYMLCHGMMYPTTFLNTMISLPFVCAGIDNLLGVREEQGKQKISKCMILAIAFQALSGFYSLYMELWFAAIYAVVGVVCREKRFTGIMKKLLVLLGHVVLGIGISAAVFVPAMAGYFSCARGGDFDWIGLRTLVGLDTELSWQIFSSIIIPSGFQEIGLMLPFLSIFLIVLAIKRGKVILEVKILLFIFCVAYVNMKIASWIAGGFTASVYYARWIFCLIFLVAVMTTEGAKYLEMISEKMCLIYMGIILALIGLQAAIEYCFFESNMDQEKYTAYILYAVFIFAISVMLFWTWKKKKKVRYYIIAGSILLGIMLNIYTIFELYGGKWYLKTYDDARGEILASNLRDYQIGDEFGRMDIQGNIRNEALYRGYYSANEYLSMINENIVEFYKQYAMVAEMWGSVHHLIGLGARSGIEDLLSVSYYDDVNHEEIIANSDYLPFGFTFDTYVTEKEAEKQNAVVKTASVLNQVILSEEIKGIKPERIGLTDDTVLLDASFAIQYENMEVEEDKIEVSPESKIIITLENEIAGECYFYTDQFKLHESDNGMDVGHVYFNGIYCEYKGEKAQYTHGVEETSICLGAVQKGINTFEITFGENAKYEMGDIHFYVVDKVQQEVFNRERHQNILRNVEIAGNSVYGDIQSDGKEILFLSIPYSAGWKAYVNGKETKILRADYGFMACGLEEGENQVYFKYTTPGNGSVDFILEFSSVFDFHSWKEGEKG